MAEQLHLERGLVGVHRLGREALRPHDLELAVGAVDGVVVAQNEIDIEIEARLAGGVRRARATSAAVAAAVARVDPALVEPAHLLGHLLDGRIERNRLLRRGRDALHEPAPEVDENLAGVRVVVAPGGLVGELDLDPPHVGGEPLELLDLLAGRAREGPARSPRGGR